MIKKDNEFKVKIINNFKQGSKVLSRQIYSWRDEKNRKRKMGYNK